jgi:hypothetical protein
MDYRFNQQAYLASYISYQLLYERKPMLQLAMREKLDSEVSMDDPRVWA